MPTTDQDTFKSRLDARFPGYEQKECLDDGGLRAFIIDHENVTETSPCYNYGYYIGDDISHTFHTALLVVPTDDVTMNEPGYAIVRINGRSFISERNDEYSVSVTCDLDSGEQITIEDRYFYEKYGGQSHDITSPIDTVLQYFQESLGYAALTKETLATWFSSMRSRFSS